MELARAWGLNRRGKEQNLRKKRSASSGFNVADEMDCRSQSYRVTSPLETVFVKSISDQSQLATDSPRVWRYWLTGQ